MEVHILDDYKLNVEYDIQLFPGYTPVVGPNGWGKTTFLQRIRDFANEKQYLMLEYSNFNDGGKRAMDRHMEQGGNINTFMQLITASEGQQVKINFGEIVEQIGAYVRHGAKIGGPVFILLDAMDSGTSINVHREFRQLFNMITEDAAKSNVELYLLMAVNDYELVKDANCINPRDGSYVFFDEYETYADQICAWEDSLHE